MDQMPDTPHALLAQLDIAVALALGKNIAAILIGFEEQLRKSNYDEDMIHRDKMNLLLTCFIARNIKEMGEENGT